MCVHTRVPRLPRGTSRCRPRAGGRDAQQWLYGAMSSPGSGGSGKKLGRAETLKGAATCLHEGAEVIMGSSGPVDADTQMGRAAESLREGAEAIEAPAAVIENRDAATSSREGAGAHCEARAVVTGGQPASSPVPYHDIFCNRNARRQHMSY